jgi:spermidine synthase
VLGLFAASGCAALIYQVVWFEQLSLAIGSSAVSLGVLLATFLGGLGLGSLLASRGARSRYAPLRRYALLELLIGVLGLTTLAAIPLLGGAYAALAGTGAVSLALRLAVAALALLPATLLMGATLPVVAAALRADARGAAWLGWCYAANTVGGVAGSVLAGFYLLRVYDPYVATFVAVALNSGCAAVAVALARRGAAPSRMAACSQSARAADTLARPIVSVDNLS